MNGEACSYTDARFAGNCFYREFTVSILLTAAAKQLPGMPGAGAVRDLREAAGMDVGMNVDGNWRVRQEANHGFD